MDAEAQSAEILGESHVGPCRSAFLNTLVCPLDKTGSGETLIAVVSRYFVHGVRISLKDRMASLLEVSFLVGDGAVMTASTPTSRQPGYLLHVVWAIFSLSLALVALDLSASVRVVEVSLR